MSIDIYKIERYINDYTMKSPLRIRYNNNLISKMIHTLIKLFILKKDNKMICCFISKETPLLLFLSPKFNNEIVYKMVDKLRNKLKIIDYIFTNKYFNEMTINNEYYVSNINDKHFTFITEDILNNKHKITKKNVNVECINTINVKNKYDMFYDIFERNGKLYLFTLELIEIWFSKMKDTARFLYNDYGEYKSTDLLLYNFVSVLGSVFKELTNKDNFDECNNNVIIHGIYKISIKEVNKKMIKHTHNITYTNEEEKLDLCNLDIETINNGINCKVSTYDEQTPTFNNNERHRYSFFINPLCKYKKKSINDNDLINLFECNKKAETKVSAPSLLKGVDKEATPYIFYDSDSSVEELTKKNINDLNKNHKTPLNISYHPTIINRDKIYSLLFDLIYKNNRFESEYNNYGYIYVFKDFEKDYTLQKYINFKFENDGYITQTQIKQSKTYHAYLTKDLLEIKSLSYIENIDL